MKCKNKISRTDCAEYAGRLVKKQTAEWKSILGVQIPYRWNIRRLKPGFTLDIGCGIGRNLVHLGGNGVGIDHNAKSIEFARMQGLRAFVPDEFRRSEYCIEDRFDSLLLAHVAEHMELGQVVELVRHYRILLKPQGRLIVITPQEAGYQSDTSHTEFMDFLKLRTLAHSLGFTVTDEYSFPFPRIIGKIFPHNEFISISRKMD